MEKNLVSEPILAPFPPNLGPKIFFHEFCLKFMLDNVASYHCMPFQGDLGNQT